MKKKTLAVVTVLVIVSSVATATFFLSSDEDGIFRNLVPFTEPGKPNYDYTKGATLVPVKDRDAEYNDITKDFRPKYPGMTEEDYTNFFGELPSFPEDFFDVTALIYEGKVTDYNRIDETYWKQPEFYSGWYNAVNDTYTFKDPKYWTPQGYGIFPLIKEVVVKSGTTVTVTGYLRTGFGTESYQGLIWKPYVPSKAKSIIGDVIFEQNNETRKLINPYISTPDNEIYNQFKSNLTHNNVGDNDWFVILKPTYSRLSNNGNVSEKGFPYDWVRSFNLDIEISSDTPPGMYCVAIKPDTPCFDINQEFYLSREHEYYGALYFPAGGIIRTNTPHFQVMLEVVE